jgi:hypothetical protein
LGPIDKSIRRIFIISSQFLHLGDNVSFLNQIHVEIQVLRNGLPAGHEHVEFRDQMLSVETPILLMRLRGGKVGGVKAKDLWEKVLEENPKHLSGTNTVVLLSR